MSNQTPTQPTGWSTPPAAPPRKRHIGRNIVLAVVALFVLGGIINAINGGTSTPNTAVTSPAATEGPTSPAADTGAAAATTPPATEAPAVKLLSKTFSGSGNWNSPPFVLKADAVKVTFRFSGNYLGGIKSNFIASLVAADDNLSVANDIAGSGGKTTTVYPSSPGSRYHLEVMADGHWTVTVQEQ